METSLIGKALNFGFNEYGFESRVSKMNYTSSVNYLLNHVSFNSKNKKLIFKIQISKNLIKLLFILKKHSIISSFNIFKNVKNRFFVYISPSYNKNLLINFYFKSYFLPSRKFLISLKALKLINTRTGNSTYIISSSHGIIDHKQAINLHKSGILMGIIHS